MIVTPEQFIYDAKQLACQVIESEIKFDTILIVTKGGLHLGYYLARFLEIKDIQTMCLSSYDDERNQSQIRNLTQHSLNLVGKNVLVVDDLIDSGKTLDYLDGILHFSNQFMKYAVLYRKDETKCKIPYSDLFYYQEIPQKEWVEFYYEL